MKKSVVVAVVALGVMPFYACSNSEQAYMERPSIEANALEAEQAEQEFAELAQKESAGEDTHTGHTGKVVASKSKATGKKVAKNDAPKVEKKKTTHPPEKMADKATTKMAAHATTKTVVAAHDTKHETKHETAPTRKVASVPVVQTGSHSKVWVVQLGAFRVKENAEKLTAKLKTGGYPVIMHPLNHSKNGQLYVVALEPTPNRTEAQKWQSDLKSKSYDTNIVLHKED